MEQIREMKVCGRDYEVTTFVDEEDYWRLRLWEYSWSRIPGYKTTYIITYKKDKNVYLHRLIMGVVNSPCFVYVDHIDHNGLNNSKNNLRITNNSGNSRNCHKTLLKTSSRYKGVSRHTIHSKLKPWQACIRIDGKNKYLGSFRTEKEAAKAYNEAVIELCDFGILNDLSPGSSC